jgi:N-ethylmaleimide reductase
MNLFEPQKLGNLILKNRIVMAPMTRSRAIDNLPNKLMARYYKQRASAGLIITEATAISPNGLGYARMPGLYAHNQIEGWKKVTQGVHQKGGNIFAQLIHTGRISHLENMPEGSEVLAPSEIPAKGKIHTDRLGLLTYPTPRAMSKNDIRQTQREFVIASRNAFNAGFDGVEIHGANGYLIEQFINPNTNQRDDEYGETIENRCRFILEILKQIIDVIGPRKIGIRLSPHAMLNDMNGYDSVDETYIYLAKEIDKLKIAYIHLINPLSTGAYHASHSLLKQIRKCFTGKLIFCGGLDKAIAEKILKEEFADFVAFGRSFVSNPDLVFRMRHDLELNDLNIDTLYTSGEKGYIGYPEYRDSEPLHSELRC